MAKSCSVGRKSVIHGQEMVDHPSATRAFRDITTIYKISGTIILNSTAFTAARTEMNPIPWVEC
jgi:hypothetical protein